MSRKRSCQQEAAELIRGKGFEPIDADELRSSRHTEPVAHSWVNLVYRKLAAPFV